MTKAQLSGILSVPINYSTVAAVLAAINQQGVSGPLTVNIAANYTETCPSGGYSLTATGTATSPVTFKKNGNGANPLLIAYSGGSGTPGSMHQDGIWRLIGSDYITIDAIDIVDPNTSNPSTMEFGYGLFKANPGDGCQNNTIRNCVINLNRINNAGGTGPASDGSRGIDVVNALPGAHNSSISVTSPSGSNSFNKFYSNTIRNCNTGVSLIGFTDNSPFSFADHGNEIGGNTASTGNTIIDFGGGGSANASVGIRTMAQYNLVISYNTINNNTGSGTNHPVILRGIYLTAAASADLSITNNTLTLHGGATGSQLSVIENAAGAMGVSNTVNITSNMIRDCSYATSTSGPFYGIWNTGSPDHLIIKNNSFLNNSTSAASGSTYLIYNNGAVNSLIDISGNKLSFNYKGPAAYGGNMYNIYNANGTMATSLSIHSNEFSNCNHYGFAGTGNIYFIYNTNDCSLLSVNGNTWKSMWLYHTGAEYFIYNNSATQSLLTVTNNSISGTFKRTASGGALYLYYGTGTSPATSVQNITGNIFSNITSTVSGSGNFYGIYTSDGGTGPFPKKTIAANVLSNIDISSTGTFYGYYCDNLGDGTLSSGSAVHSNTLANVWRGGIIYGLYVSGVVSPVHATQIYSNSIYNLNSSGASSSLYSVYLAGGGAGLSFYGNKIRDISETGLSGIAHGLYVAGSTTANVLNNMIGNVNTPNSSATNAVNGIYINSGSLVNIFYNTVYLNATSSGGNFNSNGLYCSTTVSLNLRNNILINISTGGTGIAAAFRRSSNSLVNYLLSSNNNLFYAGVPGPTRVILQSGATSYQSFTAFQTSVSPREALSVSQNINFLSTSGFSPNYLRVIPNVASPVESQAINISGIAQDFEGEIRHGNPGYPGIGSAPDIGADEYDQNTGPCSSANPGTISPAIYSLCAGQSATLSSTGFAQGTGLVNQWGVGTAPGGPYVGVLSGSGFLTPEFISAPLPAGTYYFVMSSTCMAIPASATSSEATVVVTAIPGATINATPTLVCEGQSLNLSGFSQSGTTFQWIGPNGFNSSSQILSFSSISGNDTGNYFFSASVNECSSPQSSIAISVSGTSLSLSASTPVLCLGNSAVLSLISSAVTYTWDTGAHSGSITVSPTVNTIYTVAVTNTANCVISQTIAVSVINPTISPNNILLCGNTATAVLTVNAFSSSTIHWFSNPVSTVSVAGGVSYSVAVATSTTFYAEATHSLSGCQSSRIPVTVTLSPNPMLTLTAVPASVCPGQLSVLNAVGAATYSWAGLGSGSSRTISPVANQIYAVAGKDAFGCSSTETIAVGIYTTAVISVVQTATSVCPSAVVGFTASGANSYYWNTGAIGPVNTVTPAANSNYTVYGINSQSCTSTKTLAVTTRSLPVVSVLQSAAQVCPGEAVTFTASGALSYTWLPGGSFADTFTANPLVSSVYNAIGTGINTCTNVGIANVEVSPCTGFAVQPILSAGIVVFPNPSEGVFVISANISDRGRVKVFSSLGHCVLSLVMRHGSETLDLSDFAKGIYFVHITSAIGTSNTKLILK